jgi:hypothetical protein
METVREQQLQREHAFWRRSADPPVLKKPSCERFRQFTQHDNWRSETNF